MFPVNGSLRTAPLFPRSGPGESGSPMSQVLLRRYDFPPRISGHLFASLPGSARSSSVRVSQLALPEGRRAFWARVVVQPATQSAGLLARGRETDQDERNTEKSEMRVMWIMTAVIVLFILGITGCNMLTHPDWTHGL